MRWRGLGQSDNVEDRRGQGGGGKMLFGGGLGAAVLALIVYFLGGDPSSVLQGGGSPETTQNYTPPENDSAKEFVSSVLSSTEEVWSQVFQEKYGKAYQKPVLVLFSGGTQSECGGASSATGPFYCPLDQKVYIDLSFYDDLRSKFDAPGDFAFAYVIAHEVGHHLQTLLGISDKVRQMQQRGSQTEANALSVKLELQADFLAGVWANRAQSMRNILEPGDIQEALQAASGVGDDRLQKQSQGYVVPDAFTHGTSEQRMYWFKRGFDSGNIEDGDTFTGDL
jgi:predicted metalloprotease